MCILDQLMDLSRPCCGWIHIPCTRIQTSFQITITINITSSITIKPESFAVDIEFWCQQSPRKVSWYKPNVTQESSTVDHCHPRDVNNCHWQFVIQGLLTLTSTYCQRWGRQSFYSVRWRRSTFGQQKKQNHHLMMFPIWSWSSHDHYHHMIFPIYAHHKPLSWSGACKKNIGWAM